jgi:electron transfer flavoprotein beta subunit
MKILCFVKHTPDSAAKIQVASDGKSIVSEGIDFNPSPFDEYGIENALKIKEAHTDSEVVIVSLGDDSVVPSIRKGLAMGADRGIHVKTDQTALDARAIGHALAEATRKENPDLIFFGYQASDSNDGQVPAYTAMALKLPLVSQISELTLNESLVTTQKQLEGAMETLEVKLPAAFSCTKGKLEPRFPSLPGIMKAKKKPLETLEAEIIDTGTVTESLNLPPGRDSAKFIGEGSAAVEELVKRLKTEAKVI